MSRRRMRGAVAVVLLALVAATTTLAVPPAAAEDVAPTITLQPEATFSIPGTPGVLTADASPYTSVTWQYRGIGNSSWLESGADTATWAPAFGFSYEARAVFTNGAASTLTDAVPVHYYGVPTISTHPQPISRAPGQAGSFTASYLCNSCPGGMTGTWERSTDGGATWTSLVGGTFTSTQATYPIAAVSEADAGLYRVVLRNGPIPPVTSDAALLSVAQAPSVSITGSMEGPEGSERTLTAVVDAGHPAPALSWQRSTNFGVTYQDIPGATGATFTQTLTSDAHANRIRVRATNDFGVATSTAVLVRVGIVPTITSAPPASIGAADGEEIVLATAGTGEPTPTVLWRFKPAGSSTFATIAGATDPTYSFTLGAATAGTYQVEYSNRMGTATATTEVGVSSAGTVTVSPAARTRAVGQTATFTATATSAPAAVPAWERSLDGGTTWEATGTPGTTLSVVAAPELDQSQYRAVVTNASGTAVSNVAVLTVTSAPTVTTQPTARTVEIGAATTFTSVAVGAPAPTVQWQRSNDGGTTWADIPGATATTYVPETAAADDSSRYRAVFTNVSGSTTSNAVLLRVGVPTATLVADQPYFQWDFGPGGSAPDVGSLRASYSLSGVTGNPAPTIRWYYTASGCVPSSGCAGSITFGTGTSASIPAQSKGPIVRSYKVEVKNSLGTITVPITPLVAESPWVTTSPTSGVASPGSEVTFAAAATGTPTPTVQWERSE
ncbi:MAG: hypothetical protein KF703_02715, partial [Actinobacteria bacterium]|nr:hypothetical protein [Actinomycetota bacterium]